MKTRNGSLSCFSQTQAGASEREHQRRVVLANIENLSCETEPPMCESHQETTMDIKRRAVRDLERVSSAKFGACCP